MKINLIYLYGSRGGNIMRISSELSPLIDISMTKNIDNIIDITYNEFKSKFMIKENRPKLFGKFIYVNFQNWIECKSEMFWHFISLNEIEKFGVFPCENSISDNVCNGNCMNRIKQVSLSDGQIRNICVYRAVRINWIIDIIELANNNSKYIKVWMKGKKLHVRFQHEDVDYIVIFEMNRNKYRIISAFPIFYINKKKTFDNDYQKYRHIKI